MSDITLLQALEVANAALAKATELKITEAVSVVNESGAEIVFLAQDCTIVGGRIGAFGKAMASALFGQNSGNLEAAMGAGAWVVPPLQSAAPVAKPTLPGVAAAFAPGRQPIFSQGAVPIFINGMIAGAIGCGGGTSEQDEECAAAGAAVFSGVVK